MSHPHPGLSTPPQLAKRGLRIIGLGGLGEIGRNMTVFEHAGRLLIVDCGVLFPEPDQPGVDLILPDFSYLDGRLGLIEAVVLTHAHEDHIGGIPYLLRERPDIPLVGSKLTLGLIRSKLSEHRLTPVTVEVGAGARETFGPFGLEFLTVNHSIPDALAVAIRTQAGVVLHTGDFKLDQLPLDGKLTDLGGFARLGADGVDLLMADSTNAEIPGIVTSEREIAPVLAQIFASAQQRIIVACFASHVHRVQQVLETAAAHGRKVAFVGRSMVRNMGVARDLGYLRIPNVPGGLMVDCEGGRGPAGGPARADLHRVAGRADVGTVADGRPGPPHPDRRGRHGHPRLLADPRQRECRVPRDQRADQVGRAGVPPGELAGARVRARPRGRTALRAEPGQARATSCRSTASGGTCGRMPGWPR